jgi:flagellar hook-basal body complex protein FliE
VSPDAIGAVGTAATAPVAGARPLAAAAIGSPGADTLSKFGAWFGEQLGEVNGKLQRADTNLQKLATGDVESLHRVMIELEEARLSFQLLMQVRTKALEAYQEIMRMQI